MPILATSVQLIEVNPRVMDCDCPSLEAILGGQPIQKILIDGGSGVNVINLAICRQLGIESGSCKRVGCKWRTVVPCDLSE
jgi:hypothetical protein